MEKEQIDMKAKKKKSFLKSEDSKKVMDFILEKARDDGMNLLMNFTSGMIDTFGNVAKQSLQKAIYKDSTPINFQATKTQKPTTDFTKYWTKPINQQTNQNSPAIFNRNVYDYESVEFETYAMAEYCLNRLRYYAGRNGYVTVGQYYQEARLPYSNVDLKWGWTDLSKVTIKRTFNGRWVIVMPNACEIETE